MYSATRGSSEYNDPMMEKGKMLVAASGMPVSAMSTTAASGDHDHVLLGWSTAMPTKAATKTTKQPAYVARTPAWPTTHGMIALVTSCTPAASACASDPLLLPRVYASCSAVAAASEVLPEMPQPAGAARPL